MSYKIKGEVEVQIGFGLPRHTTATRTAYTPTEKGYKVYDTDTNKEYVWNGTSWDASSTGDIPDNTDYVDLISNQTSIAGVKTFTNKAFFKGTLATDGLGTDQSSFIFTTSPIRYSAAAITGIVNDNDLINKGYVDDGFVDRTSNQTVAGNKVFSNNIKVDNATGGASIVLNTTGATGLSQVLFQDDGTQTAFIQSSSSRLYFLREASTDTEFSLYDDRAQFNKEVRGISTVAGSDDTSFVTKDYVDAQVSTGSTDLSNYVTLDGDETITGAKTLTNTTSISNNSLRFLGGGSSIATIQQTSTASLQISASDPLKFVAGSFGARGTWVVDADSTLTTDSSITLDAGSSVQVNAAGIGMQVSSSDILTLSSSLITATQPILLPADPVNNLEAATKGYVDSSAVDTAGFVDTTTAQTIAGAKTFTDSTIFNAGLVVENGSADFSIVATSGTTNLKTDGAFYSDIQMKSTNSTFTTGSATNRVGLYIQNSGVRKWSLNDTNGSGGFTPIMEWQAGAGVAGEEDLIIARRKVKSPVTVDGDDDDTLTTKAWVLSKAIDPSDYVSIASTQVITGKKTFTNDAFAVQHGSIKALEVDGEDVFMRGYDATSQRETELEVNPFGTTIIAEDNDGGNYAKLSVSAAGFVQMQTHPANVLVNECRVNLTANEVNIQYYNTGSQDYTSLAVGAGDIIMQDNSTDSDFRFEPNNSSISASIGGSDIFKYYDSTPRFHFFVPVRTQLATVDADHANTLTTKQWVLDKVANAVSQPDYDLVTGTGSAAYTLPFTPTTAPVGKTNMQVFVNGIKQIEGTFKSYTVSGSTVTFTSGNIPVSGDDVEFYGFG